MPSRDYHESLWDHVREGLEPPFFALRRRFLLAHVRAGERVLDVGCGEGFFTAALLQAGAQPLGIDVAQEPLRRASRRSPEAELLLVHEEEPWPLPDAAFDLLWAGEVIEHVLDTSGWLSEVRRVLRPGGRLLLSTPAHDRLAVLAMAVCARSFDRHFDPRSDHLRFYTARTLRALLEDFRFNDVRIRRAGGLPGARKLMLASAARARF